MNKFDKFAKIGFVLGWVSVLVLVFYNITLGIDRCNASLRYLIETGSAGLRWNFNITLLAVVFSSFGLKSQTKKSKAKTGLFLGILFFLLTWFLWYWASIISVVPCGYPIELPGIPY